VHDPSKKFSVHVVFGAALQPLGVTSTGVSVRAAVDDEAPAGRGVFTAVDSRTKQSSFCPPQAANPIQATIKIMLFM
jgi:hypothetical protein